MIHHSPAPAANTLLTMRPPLRAALAAVLLARLADAQTCDAGDWVDADNGDACDECREGVTNDWGSAFWCAAPVCKLKSADSCVGNRVYSFADRSDAVQYPDGESHTVGDLDNDGDLDVVTVVGGGYLTVAYYKNTGSPTDPTWALQNGGDDPFDGVATNDDVSGVGLGDMDMDGDLDFLVTYSGTTEAWEYYVNDGDASVPDFQLNANPLAAFTPLPGSVFVLADVDGDGDLDIVHGGRSGGLLHYLQNQLVETGTLAFSALTGLDNPFDVVLVANQVSALSPAPPFCRHTLTPRSF